MIDLPEPAVIFFTIPPAVKRRGAAVGATNPGKIYSHQMKKNTAAPVLPLSLGLSSLCHNTVLVSNNITMNNLLVPGQPSAQSPQAWSITYLKSSNRKSVHVCVSADESRRLRGGGA